MNIHVPEEIRKKYPLFDFRGKLFKKSNRTLIEAYHGYLKKTYFYSFEEDFFWFSDTEFPEWMLKKN